VPVFSDMTTMHARSSIRSGPGAKVESSPFIDVIESKHGNYARSTNGDCHNQNKSAGDAQSDKSAARALRIQSGMGEAATTCQIAILAAGGSTDSFSRACSDYFRRLCKTTGEFSKGGVTARVVLQFGLACAYMHREGLIVNQKTLFRKLDSFAQQLPKTFALTSKGHKVRSITRIQDCIRKLVRAELQQKGKGANLELWLFPEFVEVETVV
jgi:hypothetical protein